jgi:hypothetical protein
LEKETRPRIACTDKLCPVPSYTYTMGLDRFCKYVYYGQPLNMI